MCPTCPSLVFLGFQSCSVDGHIGCFGLEQLGAIERPDPLELVRNVTVKEIRQFMHWYLDKHNVKKAVSFWVKMRFWRMVAARKLLKELDFVLR